LKHTFLQKTEAKYGFMTEVVSQIFFLRFLAPGFGKKKSHLTGSAAFLLQQKKNFGNSLREISY